MKLKVSIEIDAPPETVWQVVEQIERHVDWMKDAVSITFTTSARRGRGVAFDCVTRIGPFRTLDKMTVTAWEPGRQMGIQHRGVVTGDGAFTLKGRRTGTTTFTWNERLQFPWWMGGPVGALGATPILKRVWRGNLRSLKALVENPNGAAR